MGKNKFSSIHTNSVSLEFLHFTERDFITIKAPTDRAAGKMYGHQTAGIASQTLKNTLSAANEP